MSSPAFTAEDFAKWNTTTSCFRLPKRLIGKDGIKEVRVALIEAIGADRVCAVQALPDHKYRIEFTSPSYKIGYDINGLNFRGVNITPTPAYEQLSRVIIDRAPLHMPDNYISSALAPYGRVVGVQHLTVRGFPNVCTGTRMVSMSIPKPIPTELIISTFKCSVKYRGQPKFCFGCRSFGHLSRLCPKLSGRSKGPRTMADVVSSTASLSCPTVASGLSECPPIQHMDTTQPAQPLVGAVTSRDSVSPNSSPLTLAVPDSMPSRIAPEAGHSSDSEPPQSGLSIHLSQFKESVTLHGEFSSGDSFHARSFFSGEDDPPSLLAASEQSDSLADQSLGRLFTTNSPNV